MNKKVAFLVPYPIGFAPSQRFRFEQYISFLKENNINCYFFPFLSKKDFELIYSTGIFFRKFAATTKGFTKRFFLLFTLGKFDVVFIHRECTPIGPPLFEWFITKILKKKTIYDFDDAIWIENTSASNKLISKIKTNSKVKKICKWSSLIICGNDYLKDYALKFNTNTLVIPTTIDTENLHNKTKNHSDKDLTIGWTGTHTTVKYLKEIKNILSDLQQEHNFKVHIICNKDPLIKSFNYSFYYWNKITEIDDLLQFDIGLMPLTDNEWTKGKCGFKGLQYMALEIPTIMSPVGVNNIIINDGVNGFLAKNPTEWTNKLTQLIKLKDLRKEFGKKGKQTVVDYYSVSANKKKYLHAFNNLFSN